MSKGGSRRRRFSRRNHEVRERDTRREQASWEHEAQDADWRRDEQPPAVEGSPG